MQVTDEMVEAAAAQMMQYGVNAPESTIYAAARSALTAALAKAWRPMSALKPEVGTRVILLIPSNRTGRDPIVGEAEWRDDSDLGVGEWWWANTSVDDYYASPVEETNEAPTAWMPLPEPPDTKEDGER